MTSVKSAVQALDPVCGLWLLVRVVEDDVQSSKCLVKWSSYPSEPTVWLPHTSVYGKHLVEGGFTISSGIPDGYNRLYIIHDRGNLTTVHTSFTTTTGLVGLAVEAKPLEKLKQVYSKVLGALQEIPKEAGYREYTEQMVQDRMTMLNTETDVAKIENKLNVGQIEEVIRQAEDELSLIRKMTGWKAWEPLKEDAPPGQWKWP